MYERKDHYYKRAKKEGLASRAAYKLLEIEKKFKIWKKGDQILELGAAPGGWLQILAKAVGPKGLVVAIDLLPLQTATPGNVTFHQKNFLEVSLAEKSFDLILSDLSPNLTGISFKDTYQSFELAKQVWKIAENCLKKGGHLVLKIFPGEESQLLKQELKTAFQTLSTFIPEATRKGSSEVYLVAKGYKGR